jgi:hypothetical protein
MTISRWMAAPALLVSSVVTPACVAEKADCGGSLVCQPAAAGDRDAALPVADAEPVDTGACRPSFAPFTRPTRPRS